MNYKFTNAGPSTKELWQEKTVYRLFGGFRIIGFAAAFSALGYLPKGFPLNINHTDRTVTPIKGAIVFENLAADGVAVKVKKGHAFVTTDIIGTATKAVSIVSINKANVAYDVITLSEAIGAVTANSTLHSATEAGASKILKANGLNYADVQFSADDSDSFATPIIEAKEVLNAKLPIPLTTTQITELTSRFYVIVI